MSRLNYIYNVEQQMQDHDELYNHQKEAVRFFKNKNEIALFWEMGLGKSAVALILAAEMFKRKEINSMLIIAPNQVHTQWHEQQIPKWLKVPYESQCLFGSTGNLRMHRFNFPEALHIICVNVNTFSTRDKYKSIVEWSNKNRTFIVLDEAQCIKSKDSKRTKRILYEFCICRPNRGSVNKVIVSQYSAARAILTGTPVTNGPIDLWTMMQFLHPNFFGRNYYSFNKYFGMHTKLNIGYNTIDVPLNQETWLKIKKCKSYVEALAVYGCSEDTFNTVHSQDKFEGPYKHADELKQSLQNVASFRKLVDCVDMPPQNFITRLTALSIEQKKCYDSMLKEGIANCDTHIATALNALTVLIRLQQISSGFITDKLIISYDNINQYDVTPSEVKWIDSTPPKLQQLYDDIEELDKPIIISTVFTAEADKIYQDLSKQYSCCLMTGWKKVGTIDEFQNGKYDIMVANIASISRGFNLQNSHVLLKYSSSFSLEYEEQLNGRIFRIGQSCPCEYINYINMNTIDEKIIESLSQKRNLLEYIRNKSLKEILV